MTRLAGAVIVHYGEEDLCERCLKSLLESTGIQVFPVVVDNNASPSLKLERLVSSACGLYLRGPQNPGFAAGANIGVRSLLGKSPEVIILLNPDVRLAPDCLELLADHLSAHGEVGIAGPGLLSQSDPGRWWNVGGEIAWPEGKPRSLLAGGRREDTLIEPREVPFVCGSAVAFRPDLISAVGYIHEGYFLYFEDADFSFRARKAGLKTVVVPAALAWHRGGGSSEGLEPCAAYFRARNRLFFSRAWNPYPRRGRLCRGVFALETALKSVLRYVLSLDKNALFPAWAVLDYLMGRSGKPARFRRLGW
jgi:hypothetical protein